jgi:hypothetical protein
MVVVQFDIRIPCLPFAVTNGADKRRLPTGAQDIILPHKRVSHHWG